MKYEYNGEGLDVCKSCGKEIFWVKTEAGKNMPVSMETKESHFADCPNADQHRKKDDPAAELHSLIFKLKTTIEAEHLQIKGALESLDALRGLIVIIENHLRPIVHND